MTQIMRFDNFDIINMTCDCETQFPFTVKIIMSCRSSNLFQNHDANHAFDNFRQNKCDAWLQNTISLHGEGSNVISVKQFIWELWHKYHAFDNFRHNKYDAWLRNTISLHGEGSNVMSVKKFISKQKVLMKILKFKINKK